MRSQRETEALTPRLTARDTQRLQKQAREGREYEFDQFTARGGLIDFELFSSLMRKKARDIDLESELKDAFRVLDKGGEGWIDTAQMRMLCKVRPRPTAGRRPRPPRRVAARWWPEAGSILVTNRALWPGCLAEVFLMWKDMTR